MQIGSKVTYKGYIIEHPCVEDYVTLIAHNSLKEAKKYIDDGLANGSLEKEEHEAS